MGNKNNIIHNFADPVEERQIRHFACKEMGRQIHRYIKGMCGSKEQMLRFEKSLEDLSLEEREKAIALLFRFKPQGSERTWYENGISSFDS